MQSYIPVVIFCVFLASSLAGFVYFHFKEKAEEQRNGLV